MKKALSIILAAITAMSIGTAATAAETEPAAVPDTAASFSEAAENAENTANTAENTADSNGRYVAAMHICATAHSVTGHVWLYFENLTDRELPLGQKVLEPNGTMSVGSHKENGGGTYYNAERYMSDDMAETGKHTFSMKMLLTPEQLETVNEKIKGNNFYNFFVWNCGNFATKVWNSVSRIKIIPLVAPALTILEMIILGAEKGSVLMDGVDIGQLFLQTRSGYEKIESNPFRMSCV